MPAIDDRSDDDPERIDREEAKRLIDGAAAGTLAVVEPEAVPTLGKVDPEKLHVELVVRRYRFGSADDIELRADGMRDGTDTDTDTDPGSDDDA